ncbi:MAG: FtsX-like permease family protein, partial [Candidatus Zixiibacteriota bacterium]
SFSENPYTIIISEKMCRKYFGDKNPVGELLKLNDKYDMTVAGVISDCPRNSHIQYNYIIPFELLKIMGRQMDYWEDISYYTYVKLNRQTHLSTATHRMNECIGAHDSSDDIVYELQPLNKIHLYSSGLAWDITGHGDIKYIYLFATLAIFILLIACVNFMNLSTAKSGLRAREVGIRKIVGANRKSLIGQFLGESLILSFLAMGISLIFVELLLPAFNNLNGKFIRIDDFINIESISAIIFITAITGILAGSYPAFVLSSFKPISIFRKSFGMTKVRAGFRRILVVFQFSIAIGLIVGTIVVFNQISFIQNKDLGFQKDNIVYVEINRDMRSKTEFLSAELLKIGSVKNVCTSSSLLTEGRCGSFSGFEWEGKREDQNVQFNLEAINYDYFKTLGIKFVAGRPFSKEYSSDTMNVILNEAAVAAINMDNPLGKKFTSVNEGEIIGVVKNYNFQSLHSQLEPLVFVLRSGAWMQYLYLKIESEDIYSTMGQIENAFSKLLPDYLIEINFLNDAYDNLYQSEKRMRTIFGIGSFIAIIISCLGLLGMISYMASLRVKEIGIRKVLGATTGSIIKLLSGEFIYLILMANFISWPIAGIAINKWLENFAYRTNVGFTVFIESGFLVFIIAISVIIWQTYKTAVANPVKSIRNE